MSKETATFDDAVSHPVFRVGEDRRMEEIFEMLAARGNEYAMATIVWAHLHGDNGLKFVRSGDRLLWFRRQMVSAAAATRRWHCVARVPLLKKSNRKQECGTTALAWSGWMVVRMMDAAHNTKDRLSIY